MVYNPAMEQAIVEQRKKLMAQILWSTYQLFGLDVEHGLVPDEDRDTIKQMNELLNSAAYLVEAFKLDSSLGIDFPEYVTMIYEKARGKYQGEEGEGAERYLNNVRQRIEEVCRRYDVC